MKWEFEERSTMGRLIMSVNDLRLRGNGMLNGENEYINTFVFNKAQEQEVIIDGIQYRMPSQTVLPLVANQHFSFQRPDELIAWQFNREFYCIVDHDAEVGCAGFLFYGIHHPLFISLSPQEMKSIATIEELFMEDIALKDNMQGELLRTMLKRLIIKITRVAKKQTENYQLFTDEKMDLIRRFNLLVEANYRKEHEVKFYAAALNKSPKTLTNLFRLFNCPAPSKIIHKRVILEAMRYLQYTQKSAKEIAYQLGFTTPAHFSRFFKLKTGHNFSVFRNNVSGNTTSASS